jgi:ribosomal protein L9
MDKLDTILNNLCIANTQRQIELENLALIFNEPLLIEISELKNQITRLQENYESQIQSLLETNNKCEELIIEYKINIEQYRSTKEKQIADLIEQLKYNVDSHNVELEIEKHY